MNLVKLDRSKENIGKRIKELRLEKNLTQEKLAEMMDISTRQLRRYEAGKCLRSIKPIITLYELGFDIEYILTGIELPMRLFIVGLERLPQDMLSSLLMQYNESSYEKDSELYYKEIILPISQYGQDHPDAKKVRDFYKLQDDMERHSKSVQH